MKKTAAWIIALLLILTFPFTALAEPDASPQPSQSPDAQAADAAASPSPTPAPTPTPTATPSETTETREGAPEVDASKITSISAMLVDADTGEVLYSKNADWTIFPASTTKLMTAMLVLDHAKMTDMVTIPQEVTWFSSTSSLMGLREQVGKQISVKDLLYGLMMCSGNDAAVALAVQVAGSEESFVQMMNDKAGELGMNETHFLNPYGLYVADQGQDHYSTASDMVKLAMAAEKYPDLVEILKAQTYTYESAQITETNVIESSNYLIHTPAAKPYLSTYLYDKATGMKTGTLEHIIPPGYTDPIKSYGCLVASASSSGLNLIAVIFGDESVGNADANIPNAYARWDIARYLFDYGFANYAKVDLSKYVTPVTMSETLSNAAQNDPEEGVLEVESDLADAKTDIELVDAATAKGLEDGSIALDQKTELDESLQAPVSKGDKVGTVSYSLNGQTVLEAPLVASRSVYPKGDEQETSKEYGVPYFAFEIWYLWIIIPAAAAGAVLIIRKVNRSRRKKRSRSFSSVTGVQGARPQEGATRMSRKHIGLKGRRKK